MFRNLRWLTLLTVFAMGTAACSDNGTDPQGGEFDPVATDQAVQGLQNQLNGDSDMMVSLGLASQGLGFAGGAPLAIDRAPTPLSAKVVRNYAVVGGAAEPVLPPELLGVTFEWSFAEGHYVPTARAGAPANGVTFILYAIDPITRVPVEPLVETGLLNLTDEGDASTTRIGIYAESGGTALVDYFIELSYTVVGQSDISVTAAAEGFISDGQSFLDFTLSQGATLLGSTNTIQMDVVYSLSVRGQDVSVTVEMQGEFDFSGENPVDAATAHLRIQNGTEFVDFEMTLAADNSLTGAIQYNGSTVVAISGTEADPVFTRADGEALTLEEVGALVELFDMLEDVFDVVEGLFEPFGGLGV